MRLTRSLTSTVAVAAVVLGLATGCGGSSKDNSSDAKGSASSSSTATSASDSLASRINSLVQNGIDQAQGGDLDTAEVTFQNVLVLDPGNKYALFNLGVIAQTREQTALAIKFYDKAIASDATYTPAMYNKAILLEGSDLNAAVALYEQIITIDPKASTTYLRLSFAYTTLGDAAKAAADRQKAIELDPSLASVTQAPNP